MEKIIDIAQLSDADSKATWAAAAKQIGLKNYQNFSKQELITKVREATGYVNTVTTPEVPLLTNNLSIKPHEDEIDNDDNDNLEPIELSEEEKELNEFSTNLPVAEEIIDTPEDLSIVKENENITSTIEESNSDNTTVSEIINEEKQVDSNIKDTSEATGKIVSTQVVKTPMGRSLSTNIGIQKQRWKDYLKLQNIKPEDFLQRYPNHKFKAIIEDIIEDNKTSL